MSPPTVSFNSYVEIATCMVNQDIDPERLSRSVSNWYGLEEMRNITSAMTAEDVDVRSSHFLKMEWEKRIREWQKLLPDRGQPVEECHSLNDLQFSALFLQHPFAAMSLWNVMQTFYALDRLVCGNSKEALDRVTEWELIRPFEYLEAPKVEKRWRSSLQELGNGIKDSSRGDVSMVQSENPLFSLAKFSKAQKGGSKESSKKESTSETLLRRIDGIYSGIGKLEDAQGELRRNLKENLNGVELVDMILEKIALAARRRFSMIYTYLKMDENHELESSFADELDEAELPGVSDWASRFQTPQFPKVEESRIFKPLSRANSIDLVKNKLVIVWVSTRKGDATATAMVLVFVLLICLRQLQRYLIASSDDLDSLGTSN